MPASPPVATIDEIVDNFSILDDWDDRYRYLIELGRTLAPLSPGAHNEANKVRGCASQVWLESRRRTSPDGCVLLEFGGDSDAHIVRGLVALALAIFSGHSARAILDRDAGAVFTHLGLSDHLTPQRSNGVKAVVERIKAEARAALVEVQANPVSGY